MPHDFIDRVESGSTQSGILGRTGLYPEYGKRLLDIALVVISAPISLLVVALIAVAIKIEGGPVFYRQNRVGRGGKTFTLLKIRTMEANADALLVDFLETNPAARAEWHHHQKLKNDPRVTRVGRFLRATSLDELPQVWNVLTGDMSLVGPRPMTPNQVALYPGSTYYALRPGITGPWQIGDRHNTSFAARAAYDTTYGRSLSLFGDFVILIRTIGVVLRQTGQ